MFDLEVEEVLQEVQDVLNLVDVLARSTGNFINLCRRPGDEKCFAEPVDRWLFEKKQGSTFAACRRENSDRSKGTISYLYERSDQRERKRREQVQDKPQTFCRPQQYEEGQTVSSGGYYSTQLLSHKLSSTTDYKSPRSRYLDNQALQVSQLRERLNAFKTSGASACDLVGPISPGEPPKKETRKLTSGITVAIRGGAYSSIQSSVNKSKSMFGDFPSPSNTNYKSLLEINRNGRRTLSLRH